MSTIPLLLVLAFFDEMVFSASVDFLLAVDDILPKKMIYQNLGSQYMYCISLAIRQGYFSLPTMTTNNYISPMKFCYDTSFNLPKQSQRSRSIL